MNTHRIKMLLRRELWEHKGSLIFAPAIMAALFVVLTIIGLMTAVHHMPADMGPNHTITIDGEQMQPDQAVKALDTIPQEKRAEYMSVALRVPSLPFDLLLFFILPFYCIAALYDERKDRSIAFWRSMPVSDTETILAKLATAIVVFPAIVCAMSAVVQLTWMIVATGFCWYFGLSAWSVIWAPSHLPLVWIQQYLDYVFTMLWLLPFIGVFMLAAAGSRRPFLWSVLPFPLLMLSEKWIFHTRHFFDWVVERSAGSLDILYSVFKNMHDDDMVGSSVAEHSNNIVTLLSHVQFWEGLLIGAVLIAATVMMRRRAQEI